MDLKKIFARVVTVPYVFVWIAGVGLLLRLGLILFWSQPLFSDALSYHQLAVEFLNGTVGIPKFPPGLSYYLATLYALFGVHEVVARLAMLPFFVMFSFFFVKLLVRFFSRTTAVVMLCIFCLYPTYIYNSIFPFSQLPVAAFLVAATYSICQIVEKKRTILWSLFFGLILGAMVLTRSASITLLVLIPTFLFFVRRDWSGIRSALVVLSSGLILVSLWIGHLYVVSGQFLFINVGNSLNLFLGNNPYTPLYKTWQFGSHGRSDNGAPEEFSNLEAQIDALEPIARDREFSARARQHIIDRPDLFVLRSVNRLRAYFGFDTFTAANLYKTNNAGSFISFGSLALDALIYIGILLLALVGAFSMNKGFLPRYISIAVAMIIFGYSLPYWIAFSHPTYHLPVVPLIALFTTTAVETIFLHTTSGSSWAVFWQAIAHKKILMLSVFVVVTIQIEWLYIMYKSL